MACDGALSRITKKISKSAVTVICDSTFCLLLSMLENSLIFRKRNFKSTSAKLFTDKENENSDFGIKIQKAIDKIKDMVYNVFIICD